MVDYREFIDESEEVYVNTVNGKAVYGDAKTVAGKDDRIAIVCENDKHIFIKQNVVQVSVRPQE
jgi:uncharacterized pyridoxamine 5'-phosphate oxidase family protein